MKVLLANKFFYRKGGGEVYLFDVMALLQAHGHEVIPFAMRHELNPASAHDTFFVDEVNFDEKHSWRGDIRKALRILYSLEAKQKIEALLELNPPGCSARTQHIPSNLAIDFAGSETARASGCHDGTRFKTVVP